LKVSVIIAAHERFEALNRLLRSLASQLYLGRHELIIAENGAAVHIDSALLPEGFTHIYEPRPGKCRVQNRAIRQARGEIIACLDDDLTAAPGYLSAVERFFEHHPEFAAMKGKVLPAEDPRTRAGERAVYLDLPVVDHGDRVREVRGVIGANMAFRATALARVGLFDERLGPGASGHEEESEISARLRRAGFRIGYAPEALVLHEVDPRRAERTRFLRVARERGRCRTLHERHSLAAVALDTGIAWARLGVARLFRVRLERLAREEKRLATAQGMLAGLRETRRPVV
jgi:GT2 family glycosyltransferase